MAANGPGDKNKIHTEHQKERQLEWIDREEAERQKEKEKDKEKKQRRKRKEKHH